LTEIERECLEVQATSEGNPADNSDTPPGKFKGILTKNQEGEVDYFAWTGGRDRNIYFFTYEAF